MTDEKENTWFRRNLMGVMIVALMGLSGFIVKFMYNDLVSRIGSLAYQVNKVADDHESRIRSLERK